MSTVGAFHVPLGVQAERLASASFDAARLRAVSASPASNGVLRSASRMQISGCI